MGSEVDPLDGLDAQPWDSSGRVLDDWLVDRPSVVDDLFDESCYRQIRSVRLPDVA